MKKALIIALTFLIISVVAFGEPFEKKSDNSRTLSGRVADKQDGALANAVVYLTNTRTRAVKTYIVGQDGVYRFRRWRRISITKSTRSTTGTRATRRP